jgi:N-acetyl-gamma-glutamyl-phosphate reductase
MVHKKPRVRVGVVGASGYAGGELCRLLLSHPSVDEIFPASREPRAFEHVHRNLSGSGLKFLAVDDMQSLDVDVVFLCSPAGEAMKVAPEFLSAGSRVIDLGPDFRFRDANLYESVYNREHTAAALLESAIYGVPELNRESIRQATLVANPGCYAIAALLSLHPLTRCSRVLLDQPISIHGINGTTGGTSQPNEHLMHTAVAGTMLPYSLAGHRHGPEINAQLSQHNPDIGPVFMTTAHGPFTRGIFLQTELAICSASFDHGDLVKHYTDVYGHGREKEYFVMIRSDDNEVGGGEKDYDRYPQIRHVTGSNFMHIGVYADRSKSRLRIVSVIDNLIKGAAGTAIQNMNLMFDLPEAAGLESYGY